MAAGRRNDPNEYAETPNASVRSSDPQAATTEKADDPTALADPPVAGEQDPRVTGRTSGRDQLAATQSATTAPAPEPGDEEQVADPDAAEPVDMQVRCPQWRRLTVPGDDQGEALTITEEWQRVNATDLSRVRRAARSAGFDIRAREVPAAG